MKIVCFGDSITQSGNNGGWTSMLGDELGYPHQVINSGVGGNTTLQALDRFATDVAPHSPDLVLIEFGINDAYVWLHQSISRQSISEYDRNLRELIRLVQSGNAKPVLIINHLPATQGIEHEQGNGLSIEQNLEPYNQVVRHLAVMLQLPFIDLPHQLSRTEQANFLSNDMVHLSQNGQKLYAQIVGKALESLLT